MARRFPSQLLKLVALCLSLSGCADNGLAEVELGTGEIAFEPISEGQDLELIRGPQGGYHFLVSIRTKNLVGGDRGDLGNPTNPTITLDVVHDGESLIIIGPITQGLDAAPVSERPFTHQMTGRFAIVDVADDEQLEGEIVTLSVVVEDSEGVIVEDSVDVRSVAHPDNHINEG